MTRQERFLTALRVQQPDRVLLFGSSAAVAKLTSEYALLVGFR